MQARACECVMGGFLDTMCQNTIAFASKTDHMAIWTKIPSKFEKFDQKHDQYLGFHFLLIRISRKILNLKLVEN